MTGAMLEEESARAMAGWVEAVRQLNLADIFGKDAAQQGVRFPGFDGGKIGSDCLEVCLFFGGHHDLASRLPEITLVLRASWGSRRAARFT